MTEGAMRLTLLPADTTLEAARVQYMAYRRMPAGQRSQYAFDLSESLRQTALAGVRMRHPEYSDEQARLAIIRLTLGDRLFREVYAGVEVVV
jgi:aminoglycoside phosphotransferase